MTITEKDRIGEIVAGDYRTASGFEQFGIDFCCNGNRSIEEGCMLSGIDPGKVVAVVQEIVDTAPGNNDIDPGYRSWPLDLLIDLIEKKHHRYVTTQIPVLNSYLEKISVVHGDAHPELFTIKELFRNGAAELTAHMKKEELLLFPHIKKMVESKLAAHKISAPFPTVEQPVNEMMQEHHTEGERFKRIASLTNNYEVPPGVCNTYRITLNLLKEFERDLHLHIHLENNMLFPGAIALEAALRT